MQDFQFLFVFIFFIILEIYPAHFSSHKNCAPYWQLYLHKASYCALTFQFWVQKNLLRFNNLIFFRISYFSNFVHYFDWSSSWIVWVLLCFFIILHVVQFYYTFIIHMLLISLSSSPPLSVLWGAGWSFWLTRSLLWSCSYDLPHGHRFNCISYFPDFGFLFAFSFCNLCTLFLLFIRYLWRHCLTSHTSMI